MNQAHANLMVAVYDQVVYVKVSGRADFTSSLDLKKLITELWQRGYSRFVFELLECIMMDSTFLGVLAGVAEKFCATSKGDNSALELLNPNPRIVETLETLGIVHLFKVSACEDVRSEKFEPLTKAPGTTPTDVVRTCLEAHQTLMNINPDNVKKFKDVAQFLAEDLKRKESSNGSA